MGSAQASLVASALLAAAAALAGPPARAADLLGPPPAFEGGGAGAPQAFGSGWYIRGDLGYVDHTKPHGTPSGAAIADAVFNPFDAIDLKKTFSVGGGVGYKFGGWFRADVTADYRHETDLDAYGSRTLYVQDSRRDYAKLQSNSLLFNTYLDLPFWTGVTPYVGAGIGVAQNNLKKHVSQVFCVTEFCAGDPPPYGLGFQPAFAHSEKTINLAWALTAGVAVDAGYGFQLDVGYRYLNVGDADRRDQHAVRTRIKDLDTHEVRVGARYTID